MSVHPPDANQQGAQSLSPHTQHSPLLPDIPDGLSPFDAAMMFAANGIPVVPFDPTTGKGKSCGNLVGTLSDEPWYRLGTSDRDQLIAWKERFGAFQAIATSPGAIGCLVVDVDKPDKFPKHLRPYLEDESVPYVNTRPHEHKRKGHYWFRLRQGQVIGNPTFEWGEIRCMGGGIVLPPYGDRAVVRNGEIPTLPLGLANAFKAGAVGVGSESVELQPFFDAYTQESRPHKLKGLKALYAKLSAIDPDRPHVVMRKCLNTGFGEAVIGYVSAATVYEALRELWPASRGRYEFDSLARSCAGYVLTLDLTTVKATSDRPIGMDSRKITAALKRSGTK